MKKEVHFIVGMPRSGTTWLSKCLNKHSDITVFGESAFFGRFSVKDDHYTEPEIERLIHNFSHSINNLATEYEGGIFQPIKATLQKIKTPNNASHIFDEIVSTVSEVTGKPIVIEKTPHHIDYIDKIKKHYPESRFIIMSRQAKGFMLSNKHIHEIKPKEIQKNIKNTYHPLICLLNLRRYQKSIAYARSKENTMVLKMADLNNDSNSVLQKVQKFLNLKKIEDITLPKFHSANKSKKERALSLEERIWYKLLTKEKEAQVTFLEWLVSPFLLLFSLFKLPRWFYTVYKSISTTSSVNPIKYLTGLLFK